MVRRLCSRESRASEGLLYTHSRIYPTLSQKASSFSWVAGGSVPSQLEAFKFKTKQNNPFLGSFFPSSIFVKDPTSPERSGSQNPESKYLSASSALLKLLGCSGEQAVFIVPFWGIQQISWPSGHNSQASSSKKKLWRIFKLSWGRSFLLTMDGQLGSWGLIPLWFLACSLLLSTSSYRALKGFAHKTFTPKASSWGGNCNEHRVAPMMPHRFRG